MKTFSTLFVALVLMLSLGESGGTKKTSRDWPCYPNWNNGWYCPSLTYPSNVCGRYGYGKSKYTYNDVCVETFVNPYSEADQDTWPQDAKSFDEYPCLYEIDFSVVDCDYPCADRDELGKGDLYGLWVEILNKDKIQEELNGEGLKVYIEGKDISQLCCFSGVGDGKDFYSISTEDDDCADKSYYWKYNYECGKYNDLKGCNWRPNDFALQLGNYEYDFLYQTRIRLYSNSCNLLDYFKFGWVIQPSNPNDSLIKVVQAQQCPIPTGQRAADNSPFP